MVALGVAVVLKQCDGMCKDLAPSGPGGGESLVGVSCWLYSWLDNIFLPAEAYPYVSADHQHELSLQTYLVDVFYVDDLIASIGQKVVRAVKRKYSEDSR